MKHSAWHAMLIGLAVSCLAVCGGNVAPQTAFLWDTGDANAGGKGDERADEGDAAEGICSACSTHCSGACTDLSCDPKNCGKCGHDCLGSGCQAGRCLPLALATQTWARGIAVDTSYVYWAEGGYSPKVRKVPVSGGAPVTLASSNSPNEVVLSGGYLFWSDDSQHAIYRVLVSGGQREKVAPFGFGGLASDADHIYWTDENTGAVYKVSAGGGTIVTLALEEEHPYAITVDAHAVYWANRCVAWNGQCDPLVIKKLPHSGGPPITLASHDRTPCSLAVDATSVYWTNVRMPPDAGPMDSILKVGLDGGAASVLVTGIHHPGGIVVDGPSLFWTNIGAEIAVDNMSTFIEGSVSTVGLDGGTPVTLASSQAIAANPFPLRRGIAVDDEAIYWTDEGTGVSPGAVMKLAK